MTRYLTEDDLLDAIPRLTRQRLRALIEADILAPMESEQGRLFRRLDRARAALACDLADDFDLHEDALSMMLSLIDQLHGVRAELRAVLQALEAEPEDVRRRVSETLWAARRGW
ncbi:hypothetical protein [Jhaorihella thermophila]|uniref:Chaperone modulatory protein CbpM n=1 Tax=Jhaorihella thermophila TaxID=488547 RepID=A0A1H5VJR6_9RHOB|nr:hypothetical protein [Jhaorihella thermophila]SEF86797.1 chaperone modulatory protein CbpM [Jhaorihella thermophila]